MKRMVLLLAALMTLLPFWAKDDYRYRNITMNDGLSANAVRNIVQDEYGFIWFGTDNGLCRYDGIKVQPYRIAENNRQWIARKYRRNAFKTVLIVFMERFSCVIFFSLSADNYWDCFHLCTR